MFVIEKDKETNNENIKMTKGDCGSINLNFKNADGSEYLPTEKDEVIFSVRKKKETFCETVLKKRGTKIAFESGETEKIPSGEYCYDVCIVKPSGERFTAMEGKFIIRKAVHEFE